MYTVYIKNYKNSSGKMVTDDTNIYSVPITDQKNTLIDPVVKAEMGKAGSLEFTVQPTNPYYNCWVQMKTIVRVMYASVCIFRGRVLTIDNTMYGTKKIHCEGDLAFLLDTLQEATKEEKRSEISVKTYITRVLNAHNNQVNEAGETDKVINLGYIPGNYSSTAVTDDMKVKTENRKFGSDSWETSMNALESLQNEFGGYFRTRYTGGKCYLDWLDSYFSKNVNEQEIVVGSNMIDMQMSSEVDNIFTALIPIGSKNSESIYIDGYKTEIHGTGNKRILVPQITKVFTDAELNSGYHTKEDYANAVTNYGIIYKTQKFENADTQEKLWNYAVDWIKNNYIGGLTSFTISAMDMRNVGKSSISAIFLGNQINVTYRNMDKIVKNQPQLITKTMTVTAITFHLNNPEKNEYTIGIPNNIINKTYGKPNNSKGGGGSGKQADDDKQDDDYNRGFDNDLSELGQRAWKYVLDEKYNNAEYQELLKQDPDLKLAPWVLRGSKMLIKSALQPSDDPIGMMRYRSIVLDGNTGTISLPLDGTCFEISPEEREKIVQGKKALTGLVIDGFQRKITFKEQMAAGLTSTALGKQRTLATFGETDNATTGSSSFLVKINKLVEDGSNSVKQMYGLDGDNGVVSNVKNALGLDGTGKTTTILQDGANSVLKLFDPESATKKPETTAADVEITGDNGGTANLGKVKNKDKTYSWKVYLNHTVTYEDAKGKTQTKSGFVTAEDFNIPTIDSFKTKLAVVDELIARSITVDNLSAYMADIADAVIDIIASEAISATSATFYNLRVSGGSINIGGTNMKPSGPFSFVTDVSLVDGNLVVKKASTAYYMRSVL